MNPQGPSQEWVDKITSSDEPDAPPVGGGPASLPTKIELAGGLITFESKAPGICEPEVVHYRDDVAGEEEAEDLGRPYDKHHGRKPGYKGKSKYTRKPKRKRHAK